MSKPMLSSAGAIFIISRRKKPNKIPPQLKGTILWSRLSGSPKDCARKLPKDIIMPEHGARAIVQAVHRRDPLSVVSSVYTGFYAFLSAHGADNETRKACESRFEALVSRFTAHCDEIFVPEPLLAVMLLNGARVDNNHRVSILAAFVTSMPEQTSSVSAMSKSCEASDGDEKSVASILYMSDYLTHV